MAKLPGYDSRGSMSTAAPVAMRDMAQEQQMGQNIASLGKAARDISKLWQESEDSAQKLSSQNKLDEGQRIIFSNAAEDIDYKNSPKYHEDLDTLNRESLEGFSNNEAAAKFSITANNQTAAAKIKIDSVFRAKLIDFKNANVERARKGNHTEYIGGDLEAIQRQRENIENALPEAGYVLTDKRLQDLETWDYDRAIQDAQNGTLLPLDEYDIVSGKKDDLAREVKQIAEINLRVEEIAILDIQFKTKKEYMETYETRTLSENLKILKEGEELNKMNKSWVTAHRAALLSPLGIGASTQNAYFSEVSHSLNEAEAAYMFHDDEKSATEYYKTLEDAEVAVQVGIKNGLLDETSAKMLNKMIYNKTGAAARHDVDDGLGHAIDYFEEEIEDKSGQDAAIREYVYRVADKQGIVDTDRILDDIRSRYLKYKDPSFRQSDYKSMKDVRLIRVGDTIINPLTLEQKILDKNGKWITIQ